MEKHPNVRMSDAGHLVQTFESSFGLNLVEAEMPPGILGVVIDPQTRKVLAKLVENLELKKS